MIRLILFLTLLSTLYAEEKPAPKGWPKEVKSIEYSSSIDSTMQPSLVFKAKGDSKRPLLVGLHTWSSNYTSANGDAVYARWCIENNWHFIHPHFRGPNWTPKALGSDYAVADVVSAVEYMKEKYAVDESRIYLIGVSGGGHASLLMAAKHPEIWAGVSAWCSISDIKSWWEQHGKGKGKYASHIEKATGGNPKKNAKFDEECIKRSPLTFLQNAKGVNLDINQGQFDGRKGSVPFTHSLYAFNKVASVQDRLSESAISYYYKELKLPQTLKAASDDTLYGDKKPLFRRVSNNTRVTIFNGKHEIIHKAALNWLAAQQKGQAAVWDIKDEKNLKTLKKESESAK